MTADGDSASPYTSERDRAEYVNGLAPRWTGDVIALCADVTAGDALHKKKSISTMTPWQETSLEEERGGGGVISWPAASDHTQRDHTKWPRSVDVAVAC